MQALFPALSPAQQGSPKPGGDRDLQLGRLQSGRTIGRETLGGLSSRLPTQYEGETFSQKVVIQNSDPREARPASSSLPVPPTTPRPENELTQFTQREGREKETQALGSTLPRKAETLNCPAKARLSPAPPIARGQYTTGAGLSCGRTEILVWEVRVRGLDQPTTRCPPHQTRLPDGRPRSTAPAPGRERAGCGYVRLLGSLVCWLSGMISMRCCPYSDAEAQVLGGQRLRGDGGGGQGRKHRQLRDGQGREPRERGSGGGGGGGAGGGRGGRGGGGSRSGGGGGERGGPRAQAVGRRLRALGRRRRRRRLERLRRAQGTRGAAALERAAASAVREKLLPVLQIGWVHFEEGRAAGVSGLQHVRRLKLMAEGREEGAREPGQRPSARGAGRTAAETPEREPEPLAPPATAGFGSSLFQTPLWRKVYSEAAAPRGGSCVRAALPSSRGAQLPPCTGEARREGASRTTQLQDATPALGRRPEPTRAGVAQRPSRVGLRRQEAGQSRPPPPARDLQPPIPGAQDPQFYMMLALPENSESPAGACVYLDERAGECASRVLYMPLGSLGEP
ncbi:uncharacterized protein [Equus caballus]|uniref:uncharacterized protein n=1 Tax=Equus caballus TaxID=9796 RepID=UPI0038B2A932